MVTREKVLEKRLDDVRNLLVVLVIGIIVTIPVAVFAQGIQPELLHAFLAYSTGLRSCTKNIHVTHPCGLN